ncbi:MAG TPA: sigma-70 family RNA polymerase sigma factor [Anaerolineales bacterium]|nr:sigma-70 family RNA polymerase sigma factor [Anaerolineales bacterium]
MKNNLFNSTAATTENMDDDYWVNRIQVDPNAFEVIYNRYLPNVYRFIARRVRNEAVAEDLTSIVFINAIYGIKNGRYRPENKFSHWLFSIARAKVMDYFREKKTISLEEINEEISTPRPRESGSKISSDLSKCFYELSDMEQELLTLRFSAGLDYKAMASLLDKNLAAVKMATYRALSKLRAKMEESNE